MNEYLAEITLDLDCRKFPPRIAAGQYDKGRKCLIHITANDIAYSAAGATAVIKGRRKDKSYFSENCTIDNSGNVVFTMSEAALAVSGFAYAKVVLSDSTKTYSTQLFILDVDNGLEGDVTEIDSYSVFNDCLRLLAELLGVSDATSRLDQYITVDDVLNSLTHADTDNVFSAEFTADRFIHKYAIAGSSLPETTISKTALGKLPLRHTVAVNEDGKWFVPVRYTNGSTSYTDILWKEITTEDDLTNYVPMNRTFAGLTLSQDQSVWSVVEALIGDMIAYGSIDKGSTETLYTLDYHLHQIYCANGKMWLCTQIQSQSGNPPYVFTWEELGRTQTDLSGKVDKTQTIAGLALSGNIGSAALAEAMAGNINPVGVIDGTTNGYGAQFGRSSAGKPVMHTLGKDWEELALASDVSGKQDKQTTVPTVGTTEEQGRWVVDTTDSVFRGLSIGQLFKAEISEVYHTYQKTSESAYLKISDILHDGDIPTNVSAFDNDVGYLTQHQDISGKMDKVIVEDDPTQLSSIPEGQIYKTQGAYYAREANNDKARFALYGDLPDISGKESSSNKVTSLSSNSTDDEYPSAKCVYDMIGNVETLLSQT